MRLNKLWTCPHTEVLGHCTCMSMSLVAGSVEEKEEWISAACDIVKAMDESHVTLTHGKTGKNEGESNLVYS